MNGASDPERDQALEDYKRSLLDLREWEAKLKDLRLGIKDLQKEFDITEDNIKALQSVGQIIGEVLKQLDEERCKCQRVFNLGKSSTNSSSHCQSVVRSPLCRRMPFEGR
jgi:ATP-dependent 26S proteasome regulatory subunit